MFVRTVGRRLGQYTAADASTDMAYVSALYGNTAPLAMVAAQSGDTGEESVQTGGFAWQNIANGTLSPAQVATIQANSVAQNNQVLANAVAAYGADSPAVAAIQAILPEQNARTIADIAALNPQPSAVSPSTWPWYYWVAIGVGVLAVVKLAK